jgi:superfamily II DNA or RNA helicase
MIDGSLALNDRLKSLEDFRSPNGANILLMTLGTGAVGLNLAVATRIYLLEPQWNPSIESQAIGRALRLGQTEQVRITRYVMAGTVEESNVLDRQKRKTELAGGGFGKGKDVTSVALVSCSNHPSMLYHGAWLTKKRTSLVLACHPIHLRDYQLNVCNVKYASGQVD